MLERARRPALAQPAAWPERPGERPSLWGQAADEGAMAGVSADIK